LGIATAGPTTTTEILSFTDTTTAGGAGGFEIALQGISTAIDTDVIKFVTTPAPGATALTWVVTCTKGNGTGTTAIPTLLNKAFSCP
jgi:hypothetical protein